jgi:choline dehydrogenase-like flavoprotein
LLVNARRLKTLRAIVETFVPADARIDRITTLAAEAIDGLTPGRTAELNQLLDLLMLPMKATDATRAGVLKMFADSPVTQLRTGFAALKRLSLYIAYAESEPGNENPMWAVADYPGPRNDFADASDPALPLRSARAGERVEADVVVIGSGAGGGLAAAAFARAGKRVVVLEAGGAYDARSFTQREILMADLYLDAAQTSSKDLGVAILAGGTLGGGTTVNWCTSFRLPDRIADEWGQESGIPSLGKELAPHYDFLERELGLAPIGTHNANNQVILDGAKSLGLQAGAMPRNAPADCGDGCGYCGFGCSYGKKRSTPRMYLPDVAKNGGSIYANATVLKIDLEGSRARGVQVEQTNADGSDPRRFEVVADLVVVSGGSLRTPGILARSGIRHHDLGRRLFLHPVSALFPEFPHEIRAWEGPMQSAYSDAFNYRTGNYGPKVEVAPTHGGISALALPWVSRAYHRASMSRAKYAATLIAVTRDRDPGFIELDSEAQIHYTVSPHDGENLLAGIVGMADLAFAAGATRVSSLHNKPIVIERKDWNASARDAFSEKLRRIGYAACRQIFFSAHQMGTANMGANPDHSVVDPQGRVWGYDNLIVADASLFPQSSGVNPMLTVFAMAKRVAELHGGKLAVEEAVEAIV